MLASADQSVTTRSGGKHGHAAPLVCDGEDRPIDHDSTGGRACEWPGLIHLS
jgi:hypothetical protein